MALAVLRFPSHTTPFARVQEPPVASLRVAACARPRITLAVRALVPSKSSGAGDPSDGSNEIKALTLDSIRRSLIKQEDSIIYNLLERSQYHYNPEAYDTNASVIVGFDGTMFEYMFQETEKMHAKIGRYKCPEEHPFFPENLPEPVLLSVQYPRVLHPVAASININKKIWDVYFHYLLPCLVKRGSDGNRGSSASADINILQALSKRIHYGKFVAEAKFQESPATYEPAIKEQDKDKLMKMLTYVKVEENVKRRVKAKAKIFGQEVNPFASSTAAPKLKIEPELPAQLYDKWVMPLTKEVQVQYLLRRLD